MPGTVAEVDYNRDAPRLSSLAALYRSHDASFLPSFSIWFHEATRQAWPTDPRLLGSRPLSDQLATVLETSCSILVNGLIKHRVPFYETKGTIL